MCFYIHSKHPEMKTAKRDIVCYKNGYMSSFNGRNYFRSLIRINHQYVLGKLNKIWDWTGPTEASINGLISKGFHSYSNKKKLSRILYRVKCIIPKGAHYFYNPEYQEYVSDQIIVQEFM